MFTCIYPRGSTAVVRGYARVREKEFADFVRTLRVRGSLRSSVGELKLDSFFERGTRVSMTVDETVGKMRWGAGEEKVRFGGKDGGEK